ncbi:hypothetical protein L6164_024621 [Bauhinia variegata]|nr:hypothetical protein L6164_024621 [Bauhinia variegata]
MSPASAKVYTPLARSPSLQVQVPSTHQVESSSSGTDPPTSLSLSLPGSDSSEVSNRPGTSSVSNPRQGIYPQEQPPPIGPCQQVLFKAQNMEARDHEFGQEKQFFSTEFLTVLQEMIRNEVRNYMSGIEQNGLCLPTEAIRNAVAKQIGISKAE